MQFYKTLILLKEWPFFIYQVLKFKNIFFFISLRGGLKYEKKYFFKFFYKQLTTKSYNPSYWWPQIKVQLSIGIWMVYSKSYWAVANAFLRSRSFSMYWIIYFNNVKNFFFFLTGSPLGILHICDLVAHLTVYNDRTGHANEYI